jgi:hypothetical protein
MEELFKYSGQYKLEQYIKLKEYITQGGVLKTRMHRGAGISIIGGQIFIYSCSSQLSSFEIDCFYSL